MSTATTYGASPTRRPRRTKADIEGLRAAMHDLLQEENPMSCRQVFYQMVSRGLLGKSESQYQSTVIRLLSLMRREGQIPFGWLADSTRWQRKPATYASAKDMLERTAAFYRQAIWRDQGAYVEVWLEKDALAGVLYPVTSKWDVPLMVTRSYPSLSFLYSAAEAIQEEERPCYLYYLGDHDPSGIDIPRKVEADLRTFAPGADLHFERVAVTQEQIELWGLPTRPTKRTDSRSKGFEGESVEVDAISPEILRRLVSSCIEQHIDTRVLKQTRAIERAERQTLESILSNLEGGN